MTNIVFMFQSSQQPGLIHLNLSCQTFWRHSDESWSPRLVQGFSLGDGQGQAAVLCWGPMIRTEQRSIHQVLIKYSRLFGPRSIALVPKLMPLNLGSAKESAKNPVSKRKKIKPRSSWSGKLWENPTFQLFGIVPMFADLMVFHLYLGMIAPEVTTCDYNMKSTVDCLEADPAMMEQCFLFLQLLELSLGCIMYPIAETYFSHFATLLVIFDRILENMVLFWECMKRFKTWFLGHRS